MRRYPRELWASVCERFRPPPQQPTASVQHITEQLFAATWLGHAGALVRLGESNVLVDPVLSERIGPRLGRMTLGPGRLRSAPVGPGDLPRIHVLLVTHAHFDHLDRPTLRLLAHPATVVVVPARTRRLVPRGFGAVLELRPGHSVNVHGLRITGVRAMHSGARRVFDRRRAVNSFLVDSPAGRVLFASDTAHTDSFAGLGPVDLAIFGIGAYDPREHMHATPEQVWAMFRSIPGRWLLPVHHSTFELSDEPMDEPLRRLTAAAGMSARDIIRTEPGEVWWPPVPAADARPAELVPPPRVD